MRVFILERLAFRSSMTLANIVARWSSRNPGLTRRRPPYCGVAPSGLQPLAAVCDLPVASLF